MADGLLPTDFLYLLSYTFISFIIISMLNNNYYRIIYFVSCIFNTIAMMTSSVIFITVIILPVSTYVGRYHIMILVIFFAAILGMGTLISLTLAFFGLDPTTITTDRVVTFSRPTTLSPPSSGSDKLVLCQWASLLGAATLVGMSSAAVFSDIYSSMFQARYSVLSPSTSSCPHPSSSSTHSASFTPHPHAPPPPSE